MSRLLGKGWSPYAQEDDQRCPRKKYRVTLHDDERKQLEHRLHSGTHATRKVTRARILRKAAEGIEDSAIAVALSVGRATVERTRQRFGEEGLEAREERPRPRKEPRAG